MVGAALGLSLHLDVGLVGVGAALGLSPHLDVGLVGVGAVAVPPGIFAVSRRPGLRHRCGQTNSSPVETAPTPVDKVDLPTVPPPPVQAGYTESGSPILPRLSPVTASQLGPSLGLSQQMRLLGWTVSHPLAATVVCVSRGRA